MRRSAPDTDTSSDSDSLREANRKNLAAGRAFRHPAYPPPFDRFPDCRYEGYGDLYGHLPRSQFDADIPISLDKDPYSETNTSLAQAAIDRYRGACEYPAWSNRIAEYPAPEWVNKLARAAVGSNLAQIEIESGFLIEWYFEVVIDLLPLRGFVLSALRVSDDPRSALAQVRKRHLKKPIENIPAWLVGIAKRMGETIPAEPRPALEAAEPITRIYRPDLSGVLPGWERSTPEYDQVFEKETKLYHRRPYLLSWKGALQETEVGLPRTTPEDWLAQVRSSIDPRRAKAKAAKLGGR